MADYFKVRCGGCEHKLKLPAHPGGKVACTKCKAVLVIPTAEAVEAALPERISLSPYVPEKPKAPEPPPPPERGRETKAVLADMLGKRLRETAQAGPSLDDLCSDGPEVEFD